ncbi:MAG: hypothetical protein ABJM29_04955 [Rhizobiaceae bacterium]
MNSRAFALLAGLTLLGGCVTASPDKVLSADPQGQAKVTGKFPAIGQVPVGQTVQMTPAERDQIQKDLAIEAQRGQQQAVSNSSEDYQREVARLKLLARQREEELRKRIESGEAAE